MDKLKTGKQLLQSFLTLLISVSALLGCEDPSVQVSSLGKKLSAPTLKSTNPFDQSFSSQNYVHVSGACDTRVGDLSISFKISTSSAAAVDTSKSSSWNTPPLTSDLTGTSLSNIPSNDFNCADGIFDFYLTKNDILNLWGFDPNSSNISVTEIDLKGATLIGDTQILALLKSGSSTGNGGAVATQIKVQKQWPSGYAGSGQCESFNVFLTDSNGNYATSTSPVAFSISETIGSSTTSSSIFAYSSWNDCLAGQSGTLAGVQSFTIPAGQNSIQVIYPMPSSASAFDSVIQYKAISQGLTSAAADLVTLRNSSGTNHFLANDTTTSSNRLHKDICYPVSFKTYNYNRTEYSVLTALTFSLLPSNSKLKFYTSSNCSTEMTSFTIPSYSSSVVGGVRYVSDGTETSDNIRVAVTMSSASSGTYDLAPFAFDIDITGSNTLSKIDMWGPLQTTRSTCSAFYVMGLNDHWAAMPAPNPITVNLSSTANGVFYSDSYCLTASSSVTIPSGSLSAKVYWKGVASTTVGSYTTTAAASGLTSITRNLQILTPTISAFTISNSGAYTKNSCLPLTIYPADSLGPISALTSLNFSYYVSGSYSAMTVLYSDSSCSNALISNNSISLAPYNDVSYKVYLKSSTTESSSYMSLQVNAGSGTTIYQPLNITWQ